MECEEDSDCLSDDFEAAAKKIYQSGHDDNQKSSDDFDTQESHSKSTTVANAFQCKCCHVPFTIKSNCTRHERYCEFNKESSLFKCLQCDQAFKRKDHLNAHAKKCNSLVGNTSQQKKKTPCLIQGCDLSFYHKSSLIEHLNKFHQNDVSIRPAETKSFSSVKEFNKWKENEEESTFSYFTARKGQKLSLVKHFYCQHDGSAKLHSARKTSKCNRKGRIKVGHFCIAKMTVRIEKGAVHFEYYPTHNHMCRKEDLMHHPLPEEMSRYIDEKIAEKIPPAIVYELTKERFLPKNNIHAMDGRAATLTKKRILERGRRRRMAQRLHKDDAKAAYMLATQLIDSDKFNPVLLYKPYGAVTVHGPPDIDQLPNSKDLFMLRIQTERQLELFKKHCGKIVILDETHGTNQYKYQLLTVMVVDENRRGWPVAHFITSKSDGDTLAPFFKCLKSRAGENVAVNCVITDDDPALRKGMSKGFCANLKHILSKWHLFKNFKENLRSKATRELFDPMMSEMKVILNEKNENLFKKLFSGFLNKYSKNKDASSFTD
ncbi:DNA-binding protein Ikaros [Frankliniella fusca]|uniref:DNA-binding protein Ikaros n=1 Tax=Frankliniella fusca TaxID=407009 RepID=A0AAE1LSJ1_9NEOP|nr:DNA-binding protein Ikaros [Frankliniella fusca]